MMMIRSYITGRRDFVKWPVGLRSPIPFEHRADHPGRGLLTARLGCLWPGG